MRQEKIDVFRQMLSAFNRGDVAGVIAAFDENCELREPPEMPDTPAQGFHGHNGIREWMANLRGVAGVQFEPTRFTTGGDLILSELAARGRGKAGGAPVEWTTFAVVHLRDDKIVRLQAFLNSEKAHCAAGLKE